MKKNRWSSKSNKQISSGLAIKAISQTIAMDKRTIKNYLKILQDNNILYSSSTMGMFAIQTWIFGDYEINKQSEQQLEETTISIPKTTLGYRV